MPYAVSKIEILIGYETERELEDLVVEFDGQSVGAPSMYEWYGERSRGVYRYTYDANLEDLSSYSFLTNLIDVRLA